MVISWFLFLEWLFIIINLFLLFICIALCLCGTEIAKARTKTGRRLTSMLHAAQNEETEPILIYPYTTINLACKISSNQQENYPISWILFPKTPKHKLTTEMTSWFYFFFVNFVVCFQKIIFICLAQSIDLKKQNPENFYRSFEKLFWDEMELRRRPGFRLCLGLLFVYLIIPNSLARFVVESNNLRVTSPDTIKGTYDSAIGNFGIPQYGGRMAGVVIYPKENRKGCKEFDYFGISFKSKPGALPIFVLLDRGGTPFVNLIVFVHLTQ